MPAIAGFPLHLEGSSPHLGRDELGRLLAALALGATRAGEPLFVLRLCESLPHPSDAERLWEDEAVLCEREGDRLWLVTPEIIACVELIAGHVQLAPNALFRSLDEFRRLSLTTFGLLAILRSRSLFDLHGAALVSPAGEGTLVVGPSGCGKTTTTLNLLRAGYAYGSDDVILLDARPGEELVVRPFRRSIGLPGPAAKELVEASRVAGDQIVDAIEPHVAVFPRIRQNEATTVRRLSKLETSLELLPQMGGTLLDARQTERQMAAVSALAARLTGLALGLGRDALKDPGLVARSIQDTTKIPRRPR
ncbi:MAG: hypothetical protein AB1486_18765 [Planctomycetota bacterium]